MEIESFVKSIGITRQQFALCARFIADNIYKVAHIPDTKRVCKVCGNEYPETDEFFYSSNYGTTLSRTCKGCCKRKYHSKKNFNKDTKDDVDVVAKPTTDFLSLNRASHEYNVSRRLFYRLRKKGLLQFHKLGRRTFIRKSEFECIIKSELGTPGAFYKKIREQFEKMFPESLISNGDQPIVIKERDYVSRHDDDIDFRKLRRTQDDPRDPKDR